MVLARKPLILLALYECRRDQLCALLPGRRYSVNAHIRPQYFWNQDRAIGLLVVFDHRDPGTANRKAGSVQRMHEFALSAGFRLKSNAGSASLKRFAIGTGRNLAKLLARRQPHLEVVGLCGRETHVAGTE